MHDKIITALLAILIALGGWTLSRTFSLSQDMVLIKEKVSRIENEIQDIKTVKKKKRSKKKAKNN
jgi:sensor domain CHASE-containing protein